MPMKYVALIPAYKPSVFLSDLLRRLAGLAFDIVVVDDGSGAEYESLFVECCEYAEVLHHMENSGKGAALKTGLSYIADKYSTETIVVTVDADGQHRPEDAYKLCKIAQEHTDSLVLGSRKLKENVPLRSRFGNSVTRFVYRLTTGLPIHDTQTGLRAFHMSFVPKLLDIPGTRYEYEMNVLLQFARDHIPMCEHEIETIYLDNNASSHFDSVKDSVRIYKEILKFSASSFIGFLVDYAVYSLLLLSGVGLTASNVMARVVSASVNFTLNRKVVFRSKERLWKTAVKYFCLAVAILFGNTLVLNLLVGVCGFHQMFAKVLTEILFFMASWLIQRLVVFRRITGGDDR